MQSVCHASTVHHAPFDPQNDGDLYIDLENLPPDTPTVTLSDAYLYESDGTIRLPIFIVAPMMALVLRCKGHRSDKGAKFIDSLDPRLVYDPTPENPNCRVCHLVRQLLTQHRPYEEVMLAMYLEDPIIIFEVMRELWSRFSTKVLPFSERHVSYAKRISYLSVPLGLQTKTPMGLAYPRESMEWPACMEASLEWTNGFMFLLRNDIGNRGIHSQVACFIFSNLIRLLRFHVEGLMQPANKEVFPQFYMLQAIRDKPTEVNRMIRKLTFATFLLLTELNKASIQAVNSLDMTLRKEECSWYRYCLSLVVENIFIMNMTRAFYDGVQADELYLHSSICHEKPELCVCRFARFLEATP
ncbi:hypothetical protein TSMEX_000710 [Taenia solium]|eukprot:TsM_000289400 transcript=TsM_000289400 gene=TsM_000289400